MAERLLAIDDSLYAKWHKEDKSRRLKGGKGGGGIALTGLPNAEALAGARSDIEDILNDGTCHLF